MNITKNFLRSCKTKKKSTTFLLNFGNIYPKNINFLQFANHVYKLILYKPHMSPLNTKYMIIFSALKATYYLNVEIKNYPLYDYENYQYLQNHYIRF